MRIIYGPHIINSHIYNLLLLSFSRKGEDPTGLIIKMDLSAIQESF